MDIAELLDAAKRKQGQLQIVAQKMQVAHTTLSNWRARRSKPSATEIAMLAELAELPIFETLAEVERDLEGAKASIWDRALGNLRAAGVAATVILGLVVFSALTPQPAHAADIGALPSHGRGHWFDPSTTHQNYGYVKPEE